jgi:maltooligosyltrehalose trehalohydrolase
LHLRRAEILPLIRTRFLGARSFQPQEGVLDVLWRFEGGTLVFLANLGDAQAEMQFRPESHPIWKSPGVILDGNRLRLPSWTGLFLKDRGR